MNIPSFEFLKFDYSNLYRYIDYVNYGLDKSLINIRFNNLELNDNFDYCLSNEFLSLLNFHNISSEYKVSVDRNATSIINYLFSKYVSDNTLVITTKCEHPSVILNLDKCKNILYIGDDQSIYDLHNLPNEIIKYKKVFVYINPYAIISKVRISNNILYNIKNLLIENKIDHHIVLDDVQNMFFGFIDYSIIDSIIGTAHASINKYYDLGILISKKDYRYFDKFGISKFLDILKLQLSIRNKLFLYSDILTNFYSELVNYKYFELYNNCPYKFYIIDKLNSNNGLNIYTPKNIVDNDMLNLISKLNNPITYRNDILIRATSIVNDPDMYISGINDVNTQLDKFFIDSF